MSNKKLTNVVCAFMMLQPLLDVFIYLINEVLGMSMGITSIVRPIFAISLFVYLLFSDKKNNKLKKFFFLYLSIYAIFIVLHIFNIKGYFFEESSGNVTGEIRYLITYGYYLLQMVNVSLILKRIDKEEQHKILKYLVYATLVVSVLYLISVITKTSPQTYTYPSIKEGWKGWSVSSHYVGHVLTFMLPVVIYACFEKKIFNKYLSSFILILCLIPGIYLIGTKTPLFVQLFIVLFYTIITVGKDIFKYKKISYNSIAFLILTVLLLSTFKLTFGYDNFLNQKKVSNSDDPMTEIVKDIDYNNKIDIDKLVKKDEVINIEKNLNQRLEVTLLKIDNIKTTTFDNRNIQKTINKQLYKLSPLKDKLLGYGHDTLPRFMWVETDAWTIFYCYGLIGFLLLIILPLCPLIVSGIKCLIKFKQLTTSKMLLGLSSLIGIAIVFEVGYTIQFAQTAFYFIILIKIAQIVLNSELKQTNKKKYLFAINDLSMGGAEVGLVDVINELSKTESVDLVLLRKQGPLLEKVNKNVSIYEILNKDYSKLKRKIYHILYFMGGIFTKYVYKKTIKCEYEIEVAYIEGYPAIFIANSTNDESVKIASIRVGLKNHRLKAEKIPFGLWHLKNAYNKMDKIYTVSNETTKEFIEKFPKCKYKTSTIYTYFNVDEMNNKANDKTEFKFDSKCTNFLAVGRFNEQKAYLRLVEAFDEVYKKNKNSRLHILGKNDTEYGQKVIALIKEKKLEDKIILHGIIKNPYPYIKHCDCLVSSSLYEGYPRVINEALALKKLCIGTNVTGTKEALHNGKMGLLVEDSKEGIVKGMLEVINNKNIIDNYKVEINKFDGNKQSFFKAFKNLCIQKEKMIIYMPKLSIGGMEKALVNLINYAKLNDKYDLTLYLIYKGNSNYLDDLPSNINLVVAWKYNWNILGKFIAGIKLIFRLVSQVFIEYDISISYSYQHPILLRLTRTASKNSIVYIHSNITQAVEESELKKIIKKRKYEEFKKIICVSNDAKKALERVIPKKTNIFVVNNIIDGENILEKSQEKINDFVFKKDTIYFINVCRHTEIYKRLTRIINATEKLNKEGYKFEVLFIGDGEDSRLYSSLINDKKIKNIHMLGKKTNPYPYMIKSNAFLLSSAREGYPVVFLESMVLNIPIVTTNVSDAKLDIENKYGIVVNNDDDSIYLGMKEYLDKGYIINKKFDYKNFNTKIIKSTYRIYEKD